MIEYSIPGFWDKFSLNIRLLKLMEIYPNFFYNNIKIASIHDSFPGCIWNGGRSVSLTQLSLSQIKNILLPFFQKGISIRYTFTNSQIEEKHLQDKYCNKILNYSILLGKQYNIKIGVIVNSEILKNYLYDTYADNIEIIYSTTLGQMSINDINNKSKNNILVLDYNYNNNFNLIKKLKYPFNIEILATENCVPYCKYRLDHQNNINLYQINNKNKQYDCRCLNPYHDITKQYFIPKVKMVNKKLIDQKYLPLKINKIKISGRYEPENVLINRYLKLLIKPEYQETAQKFLTIKD